MATSTLLQKVGNKVSKYGNALKTLAPNESEYSGLQETEKAIDQYKEAEKPKEKKKDEDETSYPQDRVNMGKYGSRQGEVRFTPLQLQEMTHPLGTVPVYDAGGDVGMSNFNRISDIPLNAGGQGAAGVEVQPMERYPIYDNDNARGRKKLSTFGGGSVGGVSDPGLASPQYMPGGGPDVAAPNVVMPMDTSTLPVFDEGGDIGPNPPTLGNVGDRQHQLAVVENGERVLTPQQNQQYEKEHPAQAGEGPKEETNIGEMTGQQPRIGGNTPLGRIIQGDKEEAAQKGDLIGLGKAVLNEKHLANPFGRGQQEMLSSAPTTAPGMGSLNAPPTNALEPVGVSPAMSHQAKLNEYDRAIQSALDKAAQTNDPAYQEQADRLRLAKLNYEKTSHWGTAENRPGILGKIGHIAAGVGNVAGDIVEPNIMALVPGTQLHGQIQQERLGTMIGADTEARLKQYQEETARAALEGGKTPEQKAYSYDVNVRHMSPTDALADVKAQEADAKEKEGYISSKSKDYELQGLDPNAAREQATTDYYNMKNSQKTPTSYKERIAKDWLSSQKLPDTPENRVRANQEVTRILERASEEAQLPFKEQMARLNNELTTSRQTLQDAESRGLKADELQQAEDAKYDTYMRSIRDAQDALDKSDTNMLASSIVPILATMTESSAQGIKRLNPQELARFMPKSSGDAMRWFEANYDKLAAGQIPPEYKGDLKELLDSLAKEADTTHKAQTASIDRDLRGSAVQPNVTEKGTTKGTEKSTSKVVIPGPGSAKYHYTGKNGEIFSDDGTTWYNAQGRKVK